MHSPLLPLLLGLILVLDAGCTQNSRLSQFDKLATTSQVQQFVRNIDFAYGDFKGFLLTDTLDLQCAGLQPCNAPTSLPSWSKADFDGDGRVDLLVAGYREKIQSGSREVICFLDKAEYGLKVLQLGDGFDCAVPELKYLQGQAMIRYTHRRVEGERKNYRLKCQIDTLVINEAGFIEYNYTPRDFKIEKIDFSTSVCFGTCPIFDLEITRNGHASYYAEKYNDKQGIFTAAIDEETISKIWRLANYLNFPKLENNYRDNGSDAPIGTLTIIYGGGKVKTIRDCGEHGTFGLSQLYQLLFALRTTQDWK